MELFPGSLYCGVDIMLHRDRERCFVLELNAYGDLLPRITWEGMDTYEAEVRAFLRRQERRSE